MTKENNLRHQYKKVILGITEGTIIITWIHIISEVSTQFFCLQGYGKKKKKGKLKDRINDYNEIGRTKFVFHAIFLQNMLLLETPSYCSNNI